MNKLIKLEEYFNNKIKQISSEITISLYSFLSTLDNKEIKMNSFRFTLDGINKHIFIKRVFAKNNEVFIEYTSNCYDYYILNFNVLTLADKNSLCYFMAKYGQLN